MGGLLARPTVHISDENWASIVETSGLPPEARSDVERAVSIYDMTDVKLSSIGETRQAFAAVEKHLQSARLAILKLSKNPRAIAAMSLRCREDGRSAVEPPGKARADLNDSAAQIDRIAGLVSEARRAMKGGKPGAREASIRVKLLVKFLDDILFEFTGRHVSRSKN